MAAQEKVKVVKSGLLENFGEKLGEAHRQFASKGDSKSAHKS